MPINWQTPEVKDRLLAAILASFDSNINCREVARLFGPEATYNAIENFLRKPKQLAKRLKEEAEGRDGRAASPARAALVKKGGTPVTLGAKTGRVMKGRKKGSPVKKVMLDGEEDLFSGGLGAGVGARVGVKMEMEMEMDDEGEI